MCAVGFFSGAREPEFRPALGVRACVAFAPSPDVPSRAERAVFFSPTCYLVCTVFKKLGTLLTQPACKYIPRRRLTSPPFVVPAERVCVRVRAGVMMWSELSAQVLRAELHFLHLFSPDA